jgi:hypothetical protein
MTEATDVFRSMTDDEARALIGEMRDHLRPLYKQLETHAAVTLRLRPVYLGQQPFPKRCEMIRKAFSLKMNAEPAGEILPSFFLERYAKEVVELLDALGLKHDEGVLKETAPAAPPKSKLVKAVEQFRKGENAVMRTILLKTFAAQSAIDWPELDALLFPETIRSGS